MSDKPSLKNTLSIIWTEIKDKLTQLKELKKAKSANFGATCLAELKEHQHAYIFYPKPIRTYLAYLIRNTPAWTIAGIPSLRHHYSSKLKLQRYSKKKSAVRGYRKYLSLYGRRKRTYRKRRTTRRNYPRRRYTRRRRYYRR